MQSAPILSARDQYEWVISQINGLTTSLPSVTPSEWAEANRWLPQSVSNNPGYYSFSKTPYLREIVDCLGVESPIRELAAMKGSQVGFTTGIENGIGYYIGHVGSVPIIWATADQEMAHQRLEANILPMIQQSGLESRIRPTDETNTRKTGKTSKKLDFLGGGSLRPLGAQNANKFKSDSARIAIGDEIDGWPEIAGKDGDPTALLVRRTAAYEDSRKICWLSTPTIKGQSKIEKKFLRGDQRYYEVLCRGCGHAQVLRWRRENSETGEITGIVWETDPETKQLVPGSVRYLCEACGHAHRNEDKSILLDPDHGARWVPTATPAHPSIRSYHLSALYSPPGMESWESCVQQWLAAWDPERSCPIDMGQLQSFYNNILGECFELRGEKLLFEDVSKHRRAQYRFGEVPNAYATAHAGAPIQILTCSIDVQKTDLAVAVFGWTRGKRCFLIDYWRFEGPTSHLEEPKTWGRAGELIREKVYKADDGKQYKIALTMVDSGHETSVCYDFVALFRSGVIAIKGESSLAKSVSGVPFRNINTPLGDRGFGINVDLYKERLHIGLRQGWDRMGLMPEQHFSAPTDILDDQLKELTREKRVEEIDPRTKLRRGWKWVRASGSKNELWDLMVYSLCGLDITAWRIFQQFGATQVDFGKFWEFTEKTGFFLHKPN